MEVDSTSKIKLTHDEVAELIVEALIHRGRIKPGNINISMAYNANVSGGTGNEVITFTGCELTVKTKEETK